MSTTTITFTFKVGAVLTNVTSAVLSDPTGAFGVRRLDSGAVVVADGTALVWQSVGVYSYAFADPASGLTYNYWVEFVYAGNTYRIEQDISGGTGGGTTTVIPEALPDCCISLARYAEILEIDECAFWGVDDGSAHETCDHIWTEKERKRIARYLAEAQDEIEQVTHYPLCPKWFINEQHPYTFPLRTDWGKVIAAGFRNESDIQAGAVLNYAADPATVTVATTVTDESEIKVYYPGSTREIEPSSVVISAGNVTIEIPWCRLVKPNLMDNPATGLAYADTTNYTATVDIVRVYNDTSIEAGLVWPHRDSASCVCDMCCDACLTCAEYTETACIYVRNYETGALDILPASYTAASGWTSALCSTCYCADPSIVRINYQAGLPAITRPLEDAVIRLAHSKMPFAPCGCDIVQQAWARDTKVPAVLTEERLNCPFGLSDGAWIAWRFVNASRLTRGFAIGD